MSKHYLQGTNPSLLAIWQRSAKMTTFMQETKAKAITTLRQDENDTRKAMVTNQNELLAKVAAFHYYPSIKLTANQGLTEANKRFEINKWWPFAWFDYYLTHKLLEHADKRNLGRFLSFGTLRTFTRFVNFAVTLLLSPVILVLGAFYATARGAVDGKFKSHLKQAYSPLFKLIERVGTVVNLARAAPLRTFGTGFALAVIVALGILLPPLFGASWALFAYVGEGLAFLSAPVAEGFALTGLGEVAAATAAETALTVAVATPAALIAVESTVKTSELALVESDFPHANIAKVETTLRSVAKLTEEIKTLSNKYNHEVKIVDLKAKMDELDKILEPLNKPYSDENSYIGFHSSGLFGKTLINANDVLISAKNKINELNKAQAQRALKNGGSATPVSSHSSHNNSASSSRSTSPTPAAIATTTARSAGQFFGFGGWTGASPTKNNSKIATTTGEIDSASPTDNPSAVSGQDQKVSRSRSNSGLTF